MAYSACIGPYKGDECHSKNLTDSGDYSNVEDDKDNNDNDNNTNSEKKKKKQKNTATTINATSVNFIFTLFYMLKIFLIYWEI